MLPVRISLGSIGVQATAAVTAAEHRRREFLLRALLTPGAFVRFACYPKQETAGYVSRPYGAGSYLIKGELAVEQFCGECYPAARLDL